MTSKNKYFQMFQGALFQNEEGALLDLVTEKVNWARKTLKKEDWVVWYLRLYKYEVLSDRAKKIENAKPYGNRFSKGGDLTPLSKKDKAFILHMDKVRCTTIDYNTYQIESELEHMIEMNLPEINSMVLGWNRPGRVFEQAGDFQLSWQATNEGKSTHEYGTKLIEFEDGSAWFDLEVSGCKQESELMGHCGNGLHDPNSPETVLSFRRPIDALPDEDIFEDDGQRWIPYLTFILNKKTGNVTEMKGRGNSKPAERYHDYIIGLFTEDARIKKVVGGGYKPENNFHLTDLDEDKYDKLMLEKPSLFSILKLWQKHGAVNKIGGFDFKGAVAAALSEKGVIEHEGEAYFKLFDALDLEDLSEKFKLTEMKGYHSIIDNGYCDYWEFCRDWSDHDDKIEVNLGLWIENNPADALKIRLKLESDHLEVIEDNDWDMSVAADIVALAKEDGVFLGDVFSNMVLRGNEAGAYNELYDNYNSLMNDFFITPEFTLLRELDPDGIEKFNVVISARQFFDFIKDNEAEFEEQLEEYNLTEFEALHEMIENHEVIEANDLKVPYYGFSGFCDDTFKAEFDNLMSECVYEHCQPRVFSLPFGQIKSVKIPSAIIEKQQADEMGLQM